MSRLFTLDLSYGGKSLPALVGLRSQGYDLAFFVHYLDKEVYHLVPGGNLEFSLAEGLQRPAELSDASALDLVRDTIDAITAYLKGHQL